MPPRFLVCSNMVQHAEIAAALRARHASVTLIGPLILKANGPPGVGGGGSSMARKAIQGLEGVEVVSLWPIEATAHLLAKFGYTDAGLSLLAQGFDRAAERFVDDIDVLHFHSGLCLVSAQQARTRGTLVVCDERGPHAGAYADLIRDEHLRHGFAPPPENEDFHRRVLAGYQRADFIVVASEYAKRTFVARGHRPGRILVVPYGINWASFDGASPDRHADRFRVLYVGRVTLAKGIPYLLEAFARFKARSAELVIAGRLEPACQALVARAAGADARIRVLGQLTKEQLAEQYRRASVLVLPTLADSFGFVVAEATAAGVPVIVTREAGVSELLSSGSSAFVVPARSAADIVDALEALADQPALAFRMVQNARQALRRVDWAQYRERIGDAYQTMLPGLSRSPSC